MSSKVQWGELADDDGDDNDLEFLLPPRQVIGPDEKGIKKVIEYKIDDSGNKVKVTNTIRVKKLAEARLTKGAVERRALAKFGDAAAVGDDKGFTMVSTEEILLERPSVHGAAVGESCGDSLRLKEAGGKTGGAVLMVCRTCGKKGDHWTARCPYKDQLGGGPTETFETSTSAGGAYVPPGMRAGADHQKQPYRRRSEENSLRVTNLSEDTREPDLRELFGTFGPLERAFVAIDQKTGVSRGFGFVTFVRREDAERAINKLNGYGYDNLILGVEWSAPRA